MSHDALTDKPGRECAADAPLVLRAEYAPDDERAAGRPSGAKPNAEREPKVEIELTASEPTAQQRQAYAQFWKLFLDRVVAKGRPIDKH